MCCCVVLCACATKSTSTCRLLVHAQKRQYYLHCTDRACERASELGLQARTRLAYAIYNSLAVALARVCAVSRESRLTSHARTRSLTVLCVCVCVCVCLHLRSNDIKIQQKNSVNSSCACVRESETFFRLPTAFSALQRWLLPTSGRRRMRRGKNQ